MPEFRYAQYCPLARATEIVGERWTLLVIRELLLGPKRFSDLKRPLAGMSSSVLATRLARLERRGIIAQRELAPSAPVSVYELTELGKGLLPALLELARWGARFLDRPRPEDRVEPSWLQLDLATFARKTPTPARSFAITLSDGVRERVFHVAGGENGTIVTNRRAPADVCLYAESALALLALATRQLAPDEAMRTGRIRAEGDLATLAEFPALFDLASADPEYESDTFEAIKGRRI